MLRWLEMALLHLEVVRQSRALVRATEGAANRDHSGTERSDVQRVLAFEEELAEDSETESDSEQVLVFADAQTESPVAVVGVLNGLLQILNRAVASLSAGEDCFVVVVVVVLSEL
jgi:hypothetical protein